MQEHNPLAETFLTPNPSDAISYSQNTQWLNTASLAFSYFLEAAASSSTLERFISSISEKNTRNIPLSK